eukprot:95129_1
MLIHEAHFYKNFTLSERITRTLTGAIILKVLWWFSRASLFSKEAMFSIITHVTCIFQNVFQMQDDLILKECQYLLLYLGSDLSERIHFLLRCVIAHIRQLCHDNIHTRINSVENVLHYELEHPHLSNKRRRNKTGDHINIDAFGTDLHVKNINLAEIIQTAKRRALQMIQQHFDDEIYNKFKNVINYPLHIFKDAKSVQVENEREQKNENNIDTYNILSFTAKK